MPGRTERLAGVDAEAATLAGPGLRRVRTLHGTSPLSRPWEPRDLAEIDLAKAGRRETPEGSAVNWLLKGPEDKLGDGAVLVDKEGFTRESARATGVDSHSARHDSCGSCDAGGRNSRRGMRS